MKLQIPPVRTGWEQNEYSDFKRQSNARAPRLVQILDDAITIPGTKFRFGLDALIGLIPGAGDIAGAAMTGFTILTAFRMGAPGGSYSTCS